MRFEREDLEAIAQEATLVQPDLPGDRPRPPDLLRRPRWPTRPIRGVCPEYGEMRNEVPTEGRWISAGGLGGAAPRGLPRRHDCGRSSSAGGPAVGETVTIGGVRFTVIGVMEPQDAGQQLLQPRRRVRLDSVHHGRRPLGHALRQRAGLHPVGAAVRSRAPWTRCGPRSAKRQRFLATDKRAIQMFGREEFRPIIDGITIGLQVLLIFIGGLTLGIGGVGVMNIMLVSVDERIREIGLRRALGARRRTSACSSWRRRWC